MKIHTAEFLTTAVDAKSYPKPGEPEVAFAGRSNVGKSSMINALCQRKKLVRVSNTPGRTRSLNFFIVRAEDEQGGMHQVRFCDLPGYGFAKVSKEERGYWQKMIGQYVREREALAGVVCIVDANVGPTEDDQLIVPWVLEQGRRVLVVATKIDRVPKHRRIPRLREIEKGLSLPEGTAVGFSATEKLNLDEVWERILALCEVPSPAAT